MGMRHSRLAGPGAFLDKDGIFVNATNSKLLERAHGILMSVPKEGVWLYSWSVMSSMGSERNVNSQNIKIPGFPIDLETFHRWVKATAVCFTHMIYLTLIIHL